MKLWGRKKRYQSSDARFTILHTHDKEPQGLVFSVHIPVCKSVRMIKGQCIKELLTK